MIDSSPLYASRTRAACIVQRLLETSEIDFFNTSRIHREKTAQFLSSLEKEGTVNNLDLTKNEDFLAYIEALARHNGLSRLRFNEIFTKGRANRQIIRSIERLRKKKGRASDPERLIANFYKKAYLPEEPRRLKRFFKLKDHVHQRVESEILQNELSTALQNLGFFENEKMLKKFNEWKQKNKNIHNSSIALAINTGLSTAMNSVIVSYLPKLSFLRTKNIPPELIDLIRTEGFNAAYPKILEEVKSKAIADHIYSKIRKAYLVYVEVFFATALYQIIDGISNDQFDSKETGLEQGAAPIAERSIQYLNEFFDAEKMKGEQFSSWQEKFYQDNERWPTEEEIETQWRSMDDTIDK